MKNVNLYLEIKEYTQKLKSACSAETCYPLNRDQWNNDNPLYGHCALIVAGIYYKFGGEVMRGVIKENGISHYWNRINNVDYDMTYEQFGDQGVEIIDKSISSIDRIMSNEDTLNRFQILIANANKTIKQKDNSIEKSL